MKKIVLTGGPCAGKTTLTQVIAQVFKHHVAIVPESASLLFSGGFPRIWTEPEVRRATQRAVFHVQRELETAFSARYHGKILVLDRGTVDCAAYWPDGPSEFFPAVKTTLANELRRYDRVIYLESAAREDYLANQAKNPNRIETWEEAERLDQQTQRLWSEHPRLNLIRNERSFGLKISEVLTLIEAEIRSGEKHA